MPSLSDVKRICLALPDVEEGTSWGALAWKLRGKMFACQPTNKAAEPDSLVVMLDFPQRDELLASEPDVYYLKEHYENYPCLLIRLKKVHPDALRDLLGMAWKYIGAKTKRKRPARKVVRRGARASLLITCLLGVTMSAQSRPTAEQIARAIVVGQMYASGNVYVAGFDENEKRPWPARVNLTPLRSNATRPMFADFYRTVAQDSEEHYYFPQREDRDPSVADVFSTVDKAALEDRNLARYRSTDLDNIPMSIFAWDERLSLTDISFPSGEQPRPTTVRERTEIAAEKKKAAEDADCSTEAQFLDSAKVILTAKVAETDLTIRLSLYATPGCAGHLSEIYVLDVLLSGQEPRRFEFRHYQGVI